MKKKKIEKKLLLNKSTISSLNQDQLKNIIGAFGLEIKTKYECANLFEIHNKTVTAPDTSTVNPNTMTSKSLIITANLDISIKLDNKFNNNGLI